MGLLVDGKWHTTWYDTKSTGGKFVRKPSQFRNWITRDGSAGPSGKAGFKAQKDRYHLYVSHACPWANRTMIMRSLKGLHDIIPVSVVDWYMADEGWVFSDRPGAIADPLFNARTAAEIYVKADPVYTGRVTVPILFDKEQKTIVSNESSEIIRMLNSEFAEFSSNQTDYYPDDFRQEIDEINETIYHSVNNGVYRCGFATTQDAYEEAFKGLFSTLDNLEERLTTNRYLVGNQFTEADIRLFTTLIRFDLVYVGHFKCNLRRIDDYPALSNYVRDIYQMPGIAETINFEHIKNHYYASHETINPHRIIPVGPDLDFTRPHNREALSS